MVGVGGWDSVADETGLFSDDQGLPYDFLGHFSWVPLFKGLCRFDFDGSPVIAGGREVSLQEWLSLQKKGGNNEESYRR